MPLRHRWFALVAMPAATAALSAGCSFPDVVFTEPASSSAGTAGATASSGAAGGGGGVASGGAGAAASGGGGGGEAASGSGGSGGATSGSGGGGGGMIDCDADGDGYPSIACEGGTDCDDRHAQVHPDQPNTFYDTPIRPGGGFDYDCSGEEEPQIPAVSCEGGGACRNASNVYLVEEVACGDPGPVGSCNLLCQQDVMYTGLKRACH
ncbi:MULTISPECIES: hypothetical protein [Sorangium]|uniref:Secreted protein n=1 Tax=Sorangium cellulosum TaxID=56 RepID=A0A4P2QU74_SORCE|nr:MULTISPECIES: hypothetical protein [Sorangium]AUX33865.1 uncharacterized protein SOCE836_060290 [Sorangium cellulosum]WCQ93172.1 hypothetical protein NQZ70_05920 [Sorangium sp. Soce836]